jgi:DNA-binding MarR family transcriptional regulator
MTAVEILDPAIAQIEREVATLARRVELARSTLPTGERLVRSAYLLLLELEARSPMTVAALADAMQVDISTVSRQIVPLERQGMVSRLSDPDDGRVSLIQITPLGLEQLAATQAERHTCYRELLQDWSEENRAAFADYLARLNRAIFDRVAACSRE